MTTNDGRTTRENVSRIFSYRFVLFFSKLLRLSTFLASLAQRGLARADELAWWKQTPELIQHERFKELETLMLRVVRQLEHDNNPSALAPALAMLSEAYQQMGRYDEAERTAQRAIKVARQSPDPDLSAPIQSLGIAHHRLRRFAEAETEFRQNLAITERKYGPETAVVAEALENLANVLTDTGRFLDGEPLMKRALAIRYRQLGPKHHFVGQSYYNLGDTYRVQNRFEDAEECFRSALSVYEQAVGRDSEPVSQTLNQLAIVCKEMKRWEDARSYHARRMEIARKQYGAADSYVAILESLADRPDAPRPRGPAGGSRSTGQIQ